jgi:alpha-glucosidase (family GH31 glycosyl hydrolase)
MTELAEHFKLDFKAAAAEEAQAAADNLRVTVLTDGLLRLEYDPEQNFDDRPTQLVWTRKLDLPKFNLLKDEKKLVIETEKIKLKYLRDGRKLSKENLKINIKANEEEWFYGKKDDKNLKGTYRTLDDVDGEVELDRGLLSKSGWTLVDDTESLVFNNTGWLEARNISAGYQDLYFIAYGDQYQQALKDFAKITGEIPLLPRWALGNWWSRYWEYTDQDLKELMQKFENKDIPLSVCIVDMDWHRVENEYTSGWTGYSWNKEFFPKPKEFTDWLHNKGLKTALNLHPADGVQPHEDQYQKFAEYMGIDPESKKGIEFDLSKLDFINAYFKLLHNPLEDQDGIDFWWIDWQQGHDSGLEGLDPLWGLNHLHFYDLARNNDKRKFIFSRWGGLGSHRYPIGFSGDTVVSWDSLKFQPYFTLTASNVLYGWWSHDIGGHFFGTEDRELYTRWLQFGVFSPIMRLHSTKDPYLDRSPWGHGADVLEIARDYMQLRHQLIPYLYTHSYRAREKAISLIRPMYYESQKEAAYRVPDQYYFGSELIAAPFLDPADEMTELAQQTVWLPEGEWFNYFNAEYYQGDKFYNIYGDLSEIPLFAKAGAVIPLAGESKFGETGNPEILEIEIFPGADNEFKLYEDNGAAVDAEIKRAETIFKNTWQKNQLHFEIEALVGSTEVLPAERRLKLKFRAVNEVDLEILIDQKQINQSKQNKFTVNYDQEQNTLLVDFEYDPQKKYDFKLKNKTGLLKQRDLRLNKIKKIIKNFKLQTVVKTELAQAAAAAVKKGNGAEFLERFDAVLSQSQLETLVEIIYNCGSAQIKTADLDQLVLFKGDLKEMNYNLSYAVLTESPHNPIMEMKKSAVENYEFIDLEKFKNEKWKLSLNYTDFIKKIYSN